MSYDRYGTLTGLWRSPSGRSWTTHSVRRCSERTAAKMSLEEGLLFREFAGVRLETNKRSCLGRGGTNAHSLSERQALRLMGMSPSTLRNRHGNG
jgi:hypothetical protein